MRERFEQLIGSPIVKLALWCVLAVVLVSVTTLVLLLVGKHFQVTATPPSTGWTFDELLHAVEAAALVVGAMQIVVLYGLSRSEAKWRKLLTYNEFFSECPKTEHRDKLVGLMKRSGTTESFTGLGEPLKSDVAQQFYEDPDSLQTVKAYLDGFEQLATAIRCRVVDEGYAFHLEATRVLRAYTVFGPIIELMQKVNPQAYVQFVGLAEAWIERRFSDARQEQFLSWKRERDERAERARRGTARLPKAPL